MRATFTLSNKTTLESMEQQSVRPWPSINEVSNPSRETTLWKQVTLLTSLSPCRLYCPRRRRALRDTTQWHRADYWPAYCLADLCRPQCREVKNSQSPVLSILRLRRQRSNLGKERREAHREKSFCKACRDPLKYSVESWSAYAWKETNPGWKRTAGKD